MEVLLLKRNAFKFLLMITVVLCFIIPSTFAGIGGGIPDRMLCQLHNDGTIWLYTGTPMTGWQQIDGKMQTKSIAIGSDANSTYLFKLLNNGSVWQYTGTPMK